MSLIQSVILLGLAASPVTAFWRLPCKAPLVVERADPVVNPGKLSGHVHTIMGGNGFGFDMDYNSTQASTCTSCTVHGDFSNYWTPTLYFQHQNGSFESVNQVGGATVYYLQRSGSKDTAPLEAFPEGFRMVAGDPYKRSAGTDFASQAISYNCLDYNLSPPHPETGGFPSYNCPDGLRSQVFFPSCWDGKNLDSADHKSHMAYPVDAYNNGNCPSTHPVHLVSIFYEIIWDTNKFASMWSGSTQPFVWSMGDSTGYGLHGDFVMGWDRDLLQRAVNTCTNLSGRVEDCPEFTLYPDATAEQCTQASKVDEEVFGILEKLPGCNPITDGPEEASPVKDCAAGTLDGSVSSVVSSIMSSTTVVLSSLGLASYGSSQSSISSISSYSSSSSTNSVTVSVVTTISTGGVFVEQSTSSTSATTTTDYTSTTSGSSSYQSGTVSSINNNDNGDTSQCAASPPTVTITYTQISTITATSGATTAQSSSPSETIDIETSTNLNNVEAASTSIVSSTMTTSTSTSISTSTSTSTYLSQTSTIEYYIPDCPPMGPSNDTDTDTDTDTNTNTSAIIINDQSGTTSTSTSIPSSSTSTSSSTTPTQPAEWSTWNGRKRITPLHIRAARKQRIRA